MSFGKKQIVVLSLVLMIIVAGYLQYNYNQGSLDSAVGNNKIGEAVFVEGEENSNTVSSSAESNSIAASKQANDFFAQALMDKETARSRDVDQLDKITNDQKADKDTIKKAYDAKMKLVQIAEREMKIESLVKKIGFEDVIALFSEDGSVDVIVKSPSINSSQAVQITEIVSRHGSITDFDKIHVKSMY